MVIVNVSGLKKSGREICVRVHAACIHAEAETEHQNEREEINHTLPTFLRMLPLIAITID